MTSEEIAEAREMLSRLDFETYTDGMALLDRALDEIERLRGSKLGELLSRQNLLEEENSRLKAALEFYADELRTDSDGNYIPLSEDNGANAREALGK